MNSPSTIPQKNGPYRLAALLTSLSAAAVVCGPPSHGFTILPPDDQPIQPRGSSSTSVFGRSGLIDCEAVQKALSTEVGYTMGLLEALNDDISDWAKHYQDQIARVGDEWHRMLESSLTWDLEHLQSIQLRLEMARNALLDAMPAVQDWRRLARVITPEGPLPLPQRFIHRRPSNDVELDVETLDAACWASSLFA